MTNDVIVIKDENIEIITVGIQGPAGAGLPVGGTTGQVATKASDVNFDIIWSDSGTGTTFTEIQSGTNTGATMVVGSGASLVPTGSGIIQATILANGRTISITGDLVYTSSTFDGSGNVTAIGTLSTVNSNTGIFGDASHTLAITANAKGLTTAITSNAIQIAESQVTNLISDLAGKEPTITIGTSSQYYRGDKTFQTLDTSVVPENSNLYFTTARVRATNLSGLSIAGSSVVASDTILQAFGKVQNQINALLGGAIYQGVWNASINSPTLTSSMGTKGYYYVVNVAGSTNLDGITDWKIGDWAIFNGTTWDKVDNTDAVSSVNGTIGAVSLVGTTNRITVTGTTWDISATFEALLGKVASPLSQFAPTTSAQLRGVLSDETGTGLAYFQGGDIGTPSAGIATNLTGTATGLTAGIATVANTISTVDESADTTCFPVFVTASGTQTLQLKNNTGLTFNSLTGLLSSTILGTSSLSLTQNQINQTSTASDSGEMSVNYVGYNGGTSFFRNWVLYDGKTSPVITVIGLTKAVTLAGALNVVGHLTLEGVTSTGATGTGNIVFSGSPTLTNPALGTPSVLVGTNITGTASGLTSGITNALKSATTTIDISAATAPIVGQVLTATSGTAATWQSPATSGTVTSVSIVSANGFAGTVATSTSTPAITLSTSITGVLKGNGTSISAATSGTDYSAGTSALSTGILKSTTTTGALTIATGSDVNSTFGSQTQNLFYASPNGSSGNPSFRAVVAADIPTLNQNTTGSAATLTTGRTISITGDLAYTSPSFDGSGNITAAGTLATVNSNTGSFGDASHTLSITANAKGLLTAVTSNNIQIAESQVTNLVTDLAAKQSTTLTNTHVLVGNVSNVATDVALSGDAAISNTGALTIANNAISYAKFQQVAASSLVGNATGTLANATGITLGSTLTFSGSALQTSAISGDATSSANSFAVTLATVNANTGTWGSATQSSVIVLDGKGRATGASNVTITPAIGSITGFGTGIATALGINTGSAGAPVLFNGAGGTPSSITLTNATGTAASLTAGTVTTNANSTGDVTSSGNATTLATVNTNTGTFGSATQVSVITVNGKGLITAASNTTITPAVSSITGLGSGVATFLATPSSANLAAAVTDETGSGALVFGTSPTFTTQITSPLAIFTGAANSYLNVVANTGSAYTIDPANGTSFNLTLNAATPTITLQTAPSSTVEKILYVTLIQDGTGARQPTWSNVTWDAGAPPAINQTATTGITTLQFVASGGVWRGYAAPLGVGVSNGTDAGVGYPGEVISSSIAIGSATSLTTATAKTITSINLTAGDYILYANLGFIAAAGTLPTILTGSISATTNTQATSPNGGAYAQLAVAFTAGSTQIMPMGQIRINISSSSTYYLVATATFTVSTLTAYGSLTAVRSCRTV